MLILYTDHTWPLIVVSASLLINWLWRSGRYERPRQKGSELIFGPSVLLKTVFSFGIILFVVLSVGALVVNPVAQVWWGALIFFAFVPLTLLCWPYTILLGDKAVSTRSLLRKSIQILWSDVASVLIDEKSGKTTITGHGGIEIIHHGYHVAPDEFRNLLRRRAPHAFATPSLVAGAR